MTLYKNKKAPLAITASSVTLNDYTHEGRTLLLDRAAGIAVTLPAATGTGDIYRMLLKTTVSSNSTTIKAASASDSFQGNAELGQDSADTIAEFAATAGTSDTVTLNGTTTGGIVGAEIICEDIYTGRWQVSVKSQATGTEATPFSATVS